MPGTTVDTACAAPGCFRPVIGIRCDKLYCSDACRVRAFYYRHPEESREHARDRMRERRAALRPHPARGTDQYTDFRAVWPEYVGYHWQGETAPPRSESVEERWYMIPGGEEPDVLA